MLAFTIWFRFYIYWAMSLPSLSRKKGWIQIWLNCYYWCVDLHIFTLAQHHEDIILLYLLWDELNICNIANLPNTQRQQSLFELLSIKETINYQHRNTWNPNMYWPVLDNSPVTKLFFSILFHDLYRESKYEKTSWN